MTNKEINAIKQTITEAKALIADAEEKLKNVKNEPKVWWRAKKMQEYFYIDGNKIDISDEIGHSVDNIRYENHNYFRTEADAELAMEFEILNREVMAQTFEDGEEVYILDTDNSTFTIQLKKWDVEEGSDPKFRTEKEAERYAELRRKYAVMLRGYLV